MFRNLEEEGAKAYIMPIEDISVMNYASDALLLLNPVATPTNDETLSAA